MITGTHIPWRESRSQEAVVRSRLSPSTFAWVHLHSAHCLPHKAESTPASQLGTFQDSNSRLHGPFKLWRKIRDSVIPWDLFCWAGRMIFLSQWKESTLRKTFIPTQWKTCPITVAGNSQRLLLSCLGTLCHYKYFFSYPNAWLFFLNFD